MSVCLSVLQGGLYVFMLFDYYACSGIPVMFLAILECISVGWIFGEKQKYFIQGQSEVEVTCAFDNWYLNVNMLIKSPVTVNILALLNPKTVVPLLN